MRNQTSFSSYNEKTNKKEKKEVGQAVFSFRSFPLLIFQIFLFFSFRYSVSRPVETHMSGTSKNSAQHTKVKLRNLNIAKNIVNFSWTEYIRLCQIHLKYTEETNT